MAFQHFQKIPITINNQSMIIEQCDLSNEIQLTPRYKYDNRTTETELPSSMWVGNLKLNYYLTGQDYLKQFIFSTENEPISGNIAGLGFGMGYLSNYSTVVQPNSPVLINANIMFFDTLTGTLIASPAAKSVTGLALRTSDIQINNLSSYTENILNVFTRASFDYSCTLKPNYNYFDTGIFPSGANNVFIQERTINVEIDSDNTIMTLPISGEKFGVIFTYSNPSNTGLYETIGCSGKISYKGFSLNTSGPHIHSIKLSQHHVNKVGYIYSVTTGASQLTINFNTGAFPLLSNDGTMSYVEKIFIGDTPATGYSINRTSAFDQITAPIPYNTIDDILTINTSYGNYIYPNKIHFSYPAITITGLSNNTGMVGTPITISGTNFNRISKVVFGGNQNSQFRVADPQTIITAIPDNGLSNPIYIVSDLRNISGASNNFYYQPKVSNLLPATGQWKDTITLTGVNFTGVTGIYFNGVAALSFNVLSNNTITAQTPDTGFSFTSGYVSAYGTGGYTNSIPLYNPSVPIYGFSPLSGYATLPINIYTKIDAGYLYPYLGGYKAKLDSADFVVFPSGGNSTGCLTGVIPSGGTAGYFHLYAPDGISTYVNNLQFNIFPFISISYISPIVVQRYQTFDMLLVGRGLANFVGLPYYMSISGGISGDMQTYNTSNINVSNDAQSMLVNAINFTGNSGLYDVEVYNNISTYILPASLTVTAPQNLTQYTIPVFNDNNFGAGNSNYPASYAIDSSDSSSGTFAAIRTRINAQEGIQFSTSGSVPYITISRIEINNNYLSNNTSISQGGVTYSNVNPPIGALLLFRGSNMFYSGTYQKLSGFLYTPANTITGITSASIWITTGLSFNNTQDANAYSQIINVNIY